MVTISKPLSTTRYGVWSFVAAALVVAALGVAAFYFAATSRSFLNALPWLLPLAATGLIFIAYGLWILCVAPRAADDDGSLQLRRQTRLLVLAFSAFIGAALSVGGLYFGEVADTLRAQRFAQQSETAGLKAQLVEKWLLDRSAEVQQLALSIERLRRSGNGAGNGADSGFDYGGEPAVQFLFAEILAKSPDQRLVALVAPDGKVLIQAGEDTVLPEEIKAAQAAAANPTTTRIITIAGKDAKASAISFIQPLASASGTAKAVLIVRADPIHTLFAELDKWPVDNARTEALLVSRDGDDVLMIKPPQGLKVEESGLRIPLTNSKLPAAQAVIEGNGVRTGIDYAGRPVFSAAHAIAGTPWFLVVKTDQSELNRPLRRSTASVGLYIGASVVVAGLMLFVLWSTLRSDYLAARTRNVEARAALARHFQHMVLQAYDIVLYIAPDGHILEANEAAIEAYGYSLDEFRRLTVRELRTPEALGSLDTQWKLTDTRDGARYETEHRRKDGTAFAAEVSANVVEVDGQRFRQEFVRDISGRRTLEAEVQRLSRVQRALQAANSMLLRAKTEQELFEGMCEAVVGIGGYRMANVALANHDTRKSVTFAAIAGADEGYLAKADISWGEGPRAQGPTGAAIRTGRVQVNQSIMEDPRMLPWREEALKHDFQASISLPFMLDGRPFGTLTIYSDMPNAFDNEEVALLTQFAEDISYGVAALRAQKAAAGHQPSA